MSRSNLPYTVLQKRDVECLTLTFQARSALMADSLAKVWWPSV